MQVAKPKTVDRAMLHLEQGIDEHTAVHQERIRALQYVRETGEIYRPLAIRHKLDVDTWRKNARESQKHRERDELGRLK